MITQIIAANIQGDKVVAQADSFELRRFGVDSGLTNYAASYATGLLLARRLLTELGMNDLYKGIESADGEYFDIYEKGTLDRRPFKALLDVGLVRTTTGNRVFGALKGAVDGGIFVPHNTKRFPGYHLEKAQATTGKRGKVVEKGKAEGTYNAKEHRDHIYGLHVQGYMDHLKKENKDRFKKQFSKWDATLTKAKVTSLEALYKKLHADIRKGPQRVKPDKKAAVRKTISKDHKGHVQQDSKNRKWTILRRLTREQRNERVKTKIQNAMTKKA